MSISLKTHSVYPEISYNAATKEVVGILYDGKGKVAFSLEGTASNRADASQLMYVELAKAAVKFKNKTEVTK